MTRTTRTRFAFAAAVVCVAMALLTQLQAQKPATQAELLLGKALSLEEVSGKLADAIAAYTQVLAAPDATRAEKARAQFRIGACYERLGQSEARKAYEAVVANYGDQSEFAAQAKARLNALTAKATPASTVAAEGPAVRTLWKGRDANTWAAISPDGRSLAYDAGGRLTVREIATGRVTDLGDHADGSEPLAWSPDGRQLAYVNSSKAGDELKVARVDGTSTRVLHNGSAGRGLDYAIDWSKDGRFIAVVLLGNRPESRNQLQLIDTADGSAKTLGIISRWESVRISPDSRYVACSFRHEFGAPLALQVWAADGKGVTDTIEAPGGVELVDWSPGGQGLVYVSRRDGETALMLQPMSGGRASGPPALLRRDVAAGLDAFGGRVLVNGSIVVGIRGARDDVFVASIAFDSGLMLAPPRKMVPWVGAQLHSPSWAPDGRLAFLIPRFGSRSHADAVGLHIMDLGQTMQVPLAIGAMRSLNPLRWTARSDEAYLDAGEGESAEGLYRVDLASGRMSMVVRSNTEGGFPFLTVPSPDGRTLYFTRLAPGSPPRVMSIIARDVVTGDERELYRNSEPGFINVPLALSADGQALAFKYIVPSRAVGDSSVLKVVDTKTGLCRELYRSTPKTTIGALAISPDRSRVVFVLRQRDMPQRLMSVSVADGKAVQTDFKVENGIVPGLSIHPDGKRIAYQVSTGGESEILSLDGLLPPAKK